MILPCDLPLWSVAQEMLLKVEAARDVDQVTPVNFV